MKLRQGFVSNSSSSSFVVQYTNKSGSDMTMFDIIEENRDVFISYLDYYSSYGEDEEITLRINNELEESVNNPIVIPNNTDILFHITSGEGWNSLSIINFNNNKCCNIDNTNGNLKSYRLEG